MRILCISEAVKTQVTDNKKTKPLESHTLYKSRRPYFNNKRLAKWRTQALRIQSIERRRAQREPDCDVANFGSESNIVCLIKYPSVAYNRTSLRSTEVNRSAREAAAVPPNTGELRGIVVFQPAIIVFPCSVSSDKQRETT